MWSFWLKGVKESAQGIVCFKETMPELGTVKRFNFEGGWPHTSSGGSSVRGPRQCGRRFPKCGVVEGKTLELFFEEVWKPYKETIKEPQGDNLEAPAVPLLHCILCYQAFDQRICWQLCEL